MEEYLPLIIQLVSGALGGNVAGKLLKNLSLGTVRNSIVGILGGGLGGQILGMLGMGAGAAAGADAGGMDVSSILGSLAGGGRRWRTDGNNRRYQECHGQVVNYLGSSP